MSIQNSTGETYKQSGTAERENPETGDWEKVPSYSARPGYSARDVAAELRVRILGRKESGKVVCAIDNDFGGYDCVEVSS